ncbi:histidine kinase [Leptolyngbya sp. NK1-12]|uniref:histidine kinase n=1 Tax=Leptolyngbya sp. NK1-12 TaxID=2547451 RepID=A0AA96WHT6_9CYAN|nr:histidine kinase [Leptolyngbya sp. NK1-12]
MPNAVLNRYPALSLVLSLGVGLSILAAILVSRGELAARQLRFQRQIENLGTALQRSLTRYTDALVFLGDYYAVANSQVDRQAFAEFVERPLQTYPGIQALEWVPIVQQTDRPAYEAAIRAEGYPSFQITELAKTGKLVRAGQRPYYVPVTYVEPLAENRSAFGYDLNSDPTRASAIAQARKTGEITVTGRIRLVQEQRDQFGFLVFLPLYRDHQLPDSPELRYQYSTGFMLGVFRVSDVVEEALKNLQYEIDFMVYDQSANPAEQFLGRYEAARKQVTTLENSGFDLTRYALCSVPADCTQVLTIGNRQWAVVFSPAASYPVEMQYGAIATLLGGLLLTSGLGLFLYRLKRELEQTRTLNDLKFRFFSMASHELRTPLSTILLSSELLQLNYTELSDVQKQSNVQRIHATAKQMSQQITDLLMLTRAEVGKLEFHPELLDLERFCQQIVDEMQPSLNQPIQLLSTVQTTKAFLDKKLLQSLLTNLLSNAAKYSPANMPIQFNLACDANTVTFQVRDHGIGIPAADQPRIWETFYRGSNVGEVSGTGLGLAIVKTCVELHRGEWAIESQENQGTTVTVRLPLE